MAQVLSPGEVREDAPQAIANPEWVENLNVRLICKDCREDPPDLHEDHQSGDMICGSCGLVLQQRSVDQSSEWRTFNNDEQGNDDPSRVGDGPNALLNGAQLETQISFGDGGLRNKELHRAQNKSTYDKGNKTLLQAYKVIGNLCDSFSMSGNVADSAKHLYKDAEESKYFKGKSVLAMAASCVFLASRVNGSERSFREVMEKTKLSKKEIGRTFKQLEQFTQKKHAEKRRQNDASSNVPGVAAPPSSQEPLRTTQNSPALLVERFCNELGYDAKAGLCARALADQMERFGSLAGRSPLSSAAACIYMMGQLMGDPRSWKEIGEVAKVSDSTIRSAYKALYTDRARVITEDIVARGADASRLPAPP
ncbi:hypothetical protein MBLNU230_g2033t1 [Neophaeotheca triangularis]